MVSVLWFTALAITPMNTFSISLCSVPVYCVTLDILFLKCWRPGKFDIALKNTSSCFANQGGASQYEVILKDTLMKLVEKIQDETGKDVAMRQIVPERLIYWL